MDEDQLQLSTRHDDLCGRLTQLEGSSELDAAQHELARAWRERIDLFRRTAEAPLSIAFLGATGRGKSSLIAAAAGLRLEGSGGPKTWSVLPVGDDYTTLGEFEVVFEDRDDIVLDVEPMPIEQLELEIGIFARDRIDATQEKRGSERDRRGAGEEFRTLLRAWLAPKADDEWAVLDAEARASTDPQVLERKWLSRIDREARTRPMQRIFACDASGLAALRGVLASLMQGRLDEAPVPQRTCVRIPRPEFGGAISSLIDTPGIDGDGNEEIKHRTDILSLIDDPDMGLIICSGLSAPPDPISVSILSVIQERMRSRDMQERAIRLLIVDRTEDETERQRSQSNSRRIRRCQEKLRQLTIDIVEEGGVLAIDVMHDVGRLRDALRELSGEVQTRRDDVWRQALQDAEYTANQLHSVEFAAKTRALDLRLWWEWDAELARVPPRTVDGLATLASFLPEVVSNGPQLHATMRRKGRYAKLHLVKLGADTATGTTLQRYQLALRKVRDLATSLRNEGDEATAQHVRLRVRAFEAAFTNCWNQHHKKWTALFSGYFNSPKSATMWSWCVRRFGEGGGYIRDVVTRIGEEADQAKLTLDPPTRIRNLPDRPELFLLRKVRLQNFRGIENGSADFGRTMVIIGDNGLGKTTWLEAIVEAVGVFLPGVGAGPAPKLGDGDVRVDTRIRGDTLDRQPQLPMVIDVEGIVAGRSLTWGWQLESLPASEAVIVGEALQQEAHKAGEDIRAHSNRQLPVLAYYGTQRLWPTNIGHTDDLASNRIRDGYRDCLSAASTHQHLLNWMRKYTFAQVQDNKPIAQLAAIERAVVSCIEGAVAFRYHIVSEELKLILADGQEKPFGMLSDGYRNMVAMVADIAWRACALNPHLRDLAPELAEGLVLIDEVDLHLHPNWQRRVLGDLRRAFPRLQFIATTHSPFIVQSLEPGQLLNLDPEVRGGPYANESPEDIAERHMGVELPQRSERRRHEYEVASHYYDLLEQIPEADEVELAKLKAELDTILAPYSDNQAYVAFLELRRHMQETRRS